MLCNNEVQAPLNTSPFGLNIVPLMKKQITSWMRAKNNQKKCQVVEAQFEYKSQNLPYKEPKNKL